MKNKRTWKGIVIIFAIIMVIGFIITGCKDEDTTEKKCPPHAWGGNVITASTCITAGYTTQTCSGCGDTQQINPTNPTGVHIWGGNIITNPTCIAGGYSTQGCSTCTATQQTNQTNPTGMHTWGGNVITAPNCTTGGYTAQTCSGCGDTQQINPTNPTGVHTWGGNVITAPNCTSEGYTTQTCHACSTTQQINQTAINPNAHSWSGWEYNGTGYTRTCQNNPSHTETNTSFIEMVQIISGDFIMGSPWEERLRYNNEEQRGIYISKNFYIGKYEVTQGQWKAVMDGANPSFYQTSDNHPVEGVSWYDILVFCNKLSIMEGRSPAYRINGSTNPSDWGTVPTSSYDVWNAVTIISGSSGYRLPTEAQWEYACRADTTTAFYNGNNYDSETGYDSALVGNVAWFIGNSGSRTQAVGQKAPNAFNLYDMHGNVWEWCWDWYGSYSYTSGGTSDPTGPASGSHRVCRGGG